MWFGGEHSNKTSATDTSSQDGRHHSFTCYFKRVKAQNTINLTHSLTLLPTSAVPVAHQWETQNCKCWELVEVVLHTLSSLIWRKGPLELSVITLLHAWTVHQFALIWRLLWCSGEKSALGTRRHRYESWHCHSAAVCPWTSHAASLSLPSFCEWHFHNLPHRLVGRLNDIMDVKTLYKIWSTVHTRDTRMLRVMVSSEVTTGTCIGCFLPCWAPWGLLTSSEGRESGGFISRGPSILRALRNNIDAWAGSHFFFLHTQASRRSAWNCIV